MCDAHDLSSFKEVMANNLPNLGRVLYIQYLDAHRSPNTSNETFSRTLCSTTMRIKLILKSSRKKETHNLQRNPHNAISNFLAENIQARRKQDDIFNMLKKTNRKICQPRMLIPIKLTFINEEEIKTFPRQTKAGEFHHHQTCLIEKAERSS